MGLPCGNRTVLRGGARGDLDTEAVLGGHLGHLGYSSSSTRGTKGIGILREIRGALGIN